jgi:hypothetical protein
MEGGEKVLCNQGSHLQILTNQGWRLAKLRTTNGVLVAASPEKADFIIIPPQSDAVFIFQFSRIFFKVEPGQQVRVVVDAWPNEQSMKNGEQTIKLITQPFKCPG